MWQYQNAVFPLGNRRQLNTGQVVSIEEGDLSHGLSVRQQGKGKGGEFTYETKAVLQGCVNYGSVTAKKDCVGGLAGRMDLGTALDCQNYGPVESTPPRCPGV